VIEKYSGFIIPAYLNNTSKTPKSLLDKLAKSKNVLTKIIKKYIR